MKNLIIRAICKLPETRLKNTIRHVLLNFHPGLPTKLMVNKGDTILIAGIRHPATVCDWVDATGKEGALIFVEADARNVETLTAHIAEKGYKNIQLLRCALGKEEGEARFLVSDRPSDNRLQNESIIMDNDLREDYADEIVVPVKSIDSITNELGLKKIDFVSLTINGAELDAIKGMSQSSSIVARIYSKAHALEEESKQPINQQITQILREYGFSTNIARPTKGIVDGWMVRAGDVFGWRN